LKIRDAERYLDRRIDGKKKEGEEEKNERIGI